jgi:putative ABC transport system permease protein
MRLWRLLVRQWRSHPGRALATVVSVAVAVGAIVATWASADASRAGFRRLVETVEGQPSVDVVARGGGRFDVDQLPSLAGIEGVKAVVPLFFRPTLLRVGERRVREIAVGVDLESLVATGIITLAGGRACTAGDEVVLESTLARGLGLSVGDEVLFFARRSIRRMQVVGLVDRQEIGWLAEGAGVLVDIQSLAGMSRAIGFIDRARVVLERDASRPAVLARAAVALPPTLLAEVPAGRASMAEDVLHAANLGLDFVTGLTVAMAFFIVGNAMLMNVSERRRGFSLLRLVGATARQVRWFVVGEAALLGAVGAAIGAVAGIAAAGPIAAGVSLALKAPAAGVAASPGPIAAGVLMGLAVAVAAAWWPAREAVGIDPLEGLANAPPPPPARGMPWRFVMLVAALAALAWGVQGMVIAEWLPARAAVPAGIVLLVAFVAVTPLVLPTLARMLAAMVPGRFRLEAKLALEQILRQPIRTALTSGVLVVAVTNGIGLGHAIRDNVDNVLGWYTRLLRADWVLSRASMLRAGDLEAEGESRSAEVEVKALPGVQRVDAIGVAAGRVAGVACVVVARDIPADEPLPLEPVDASEADVRAALDRGEAVIGTVLARRTGIAPGDEVSAEVFGRATKVRVAALVVDYTSGGASLHVRRDVARRLFGFDSADFLLVVAKPESAASLRAPLEEIADHHSLLLRSFADLQTFIDTIVNGTVGALWAILGLGFVVGSIGVANTVSMNVLEKKRTLGLLRAVGMTRRQVTLVVVLESLLLGVAGSLIGLIGGISTAFFIQLASQPLLGHPIEASFRPGVVAANLAVAVGVTLVAAWLPTRRAVRIDLLEAVSAE